MKNTLLVLLSSFVISYVNAQVKNYYNIQFYNALHHEAKVKASFANIQPGKVVLEMANNSPGRLGTYNFIKNIYNLKITDGSGNNLEVRKMGLDKWEIDEHDGVINLNYTVFADKGNETFSQINDDFVLLNHPATFMYIPTLASRPVEITYDIRNKSTWKVVNQMKPSKNKQITYEAIDLDDFMDSPTLIGNIQSVKKTIESGSKDYQLGISAISQIGARDLEQLLDQISKVTEEQKQIFGGYPNFTNKRYDLILGTNASFGDINEGHKNSALLTKGQSVSTLESEKIIKGFSKSFFQAWNSTRIKPVKLKPFNYKELALVQEYWFTEGFAEYYALLTLCRAQIISQDSFLQKIAYHLSDVLSSPALKYNNAVQMSERVSLVKGLSKYGDAQNIANTVIPVDKHGAVIALMLDLSLRDEELSLDDFMKLLWTKYGKIDQAFSIENFYSSLREYAGESFTEDFFEDYIYGNEPFDFPKLLEGFGVSTTPIEVPYIGAKVAFDKNDSAVISDYTTINTPAYQSGLEKGDIIISIDNASFSDLIEYRNIISRYKIGKKINLKFNRNGQEKNAEVKLVANPNIILSSSMLKSGSKTSEKRRLWLGEE